MPYGEDGFVIPPVPPAPGPSNADAILGTPGNGIIKRTGANTYVAATSGTDYLLPNGSAAALTSFPTLNQNTSGSSASCTGNAATASAVGSITDHAVKSDQTTATSTTLAVTPAIQQNHPSAAKAWVNYSMGSGGATINSSFNVSSVTRNGAGNYTINFTTAFTSSNYVGIATAENDSANALYFATGYGRMAGSYTVIITNTSLSGSDSPVAMVACFGTQ